MLTRGGRPKQVHVPWTKEDDDAMRRLYPLRDVAAVQRALPHRRRGSIHQRAHALGLTYRVKWTRRQDMQLLYLWETGMRIAAIAKRVGGRSKMAVYRRAVELGLSAGAPDGWEYIRACADRVGINPVALVRVCAWASVEIKNALSRPDIVSHRQIRRHIVESEAAEEALKKWWNAETGEEAARRHSVAATTMRRWMKDAGLVPPNNKSGSPVRIPTEVIDRVVAERRARKEQDQ